MTTGGTKTRGKATKEAARRFNEREQEFVHSQRGQEQIERAGDVSADEESELEKAEDKGRERAREEDPDVAKDPIKPS